MQKLRRTGLRSRILFATVLLAFANSGNTSINSLEHDQRCRASHSIFETDHSCKGAKGSLRIEDLTVLDFTIGVTTIKDVQKRFPGTHLAKLAQGEEAEEGICVKNEEGAAVVFATSVMGPGETLTSIYLTPACLVESSRLTCQRVKLPKETLSSKSGIAVGGASARLSRIVGAKLPTAGPFCAAYEIDSSQGLLQRRNEMKLEGFTDFTGAQGVVAKGKLKWVKLFGITSN